MMVMCNDTLMQYFSNRGSEKHQFYDMLIGVFKKFYIPIKTSKSL